MSADASFVEDITFSTQMGRSNRLCTNLLFLPTDSLAGTLYRESHPLFDGLNLGSFRRRTRNMARRKIEEASDLEEFAEAVPPETLPTVRVGDWVNYVMADGVTIRPALVTAFFFDKTRNELKANLQVFVDGSNDNDIRGPHANATLTDWKTSVLFMGTEDPEYGFFAGTWHLR